MMISDPEGFKVRVRDSLKRQVHAINALVKRDRMYFFDYGNAFLYEAEKAGAEIRDQQTGKLRYNSYV